MTTQEAQSKDHFGALESLRGVAAFCVVLYHIDWINSLTGYNFFRNSFLMVDFFFVLSGFVIYHSYNSRITSFKTAGKFVFLRIGRLYPLHIATLMAFLIIEISKLLVEVNLGMVANTPAFTLNNTQSFTANLFMVHAWNLQVRPTWNGPSWSISAEFFAYLSFACAMLLFGKYKKTIIYISPAISLLCFYYLYSRFGKLDVFTHGSVVRCLAGFYLGVFIYQIRTIILKHMQAGNYDAFINYVLAITFLGIVWFMSVSNAGRADFVQPALFTIVVLCVSLMSHNYGLNSVLNIRPLRWLGVVSYSVYMVHQIVLWVASQFLRIILEAPERSGHLDSGAVTGNILMVISVVTILLMSQYTFTYIEDVYRNKAKKISRRVWPVR